MGQLACLACRFGCGFCCLVLANKLGFAAGLTGALSVGDLGVIALFADPDRATLPLQMYRLMGNYRTDAAAGAALILLVLAFGLFWIMDYWGASQCYC